MTIISDLDEAIGDIEAMAQLGRKLGPVRIRMGPSALAALAALHPQRPDYNAREWRPDRYRGYPIDAVPDPSSPGDVHCQDGHPCRFNGWELVA